MHSTSFFIVLVLFLFTPKVSERNLLKENRQRNIFFVQTLALHLISQHTIYYTTATSATDLVIKNIRLLENFALFAKMLKLTTMFMDLQLAIIECLWQNVWVMHDNHCLQIFSILRADSRSLKKLFHFVLKHWVGGRFILFHKEKSQYNVLHKWLFRHCLSAKRYNYCTAFGYLTVT